MKGAILLGLLVGICTAPFKGSAAPAASTPKPPTLKAPDEEDAGYAAIAVFTHALQLIRQDYVDEKKTGYQELIYSAMRGMLISADGPRTGTVSSAIDGCRAATPQVP